jgi:hypothetical protein
VTAKKIDLSEFRRIRRAGCNFANLPLKDEHVEVLKAAMQADDISGSGIHEWLKSKGYVIGKESINKHRDGRCVCR